MAFPNRPKIEMDNVFAGVESNYQNVIFSTGDYDKGLQVGRFAEWDKTTGKLVAVDTSTTTADIAGVVLRSVNNAIENADTLDPAICENANYLHWGIVTVSADGEVPKKFDKIHVNKGTTSPKKAGLAQKDIGTDGIEVNAYFLEEVQAGVWRVFIK